MSATTDVFVLLLASTTILCASDSDLVPNGSFEEGQATPIEWALSGGTGAWEKEGHTGKRCISVTGDGQSSNFWKCLEIKIAPGNLYRIDFWTKSSPDASGGTVVSGTNLCNVDFRHTTEWTPRSVIFRAPERNDPHFLRFGQWQAKGKVYFDDIRMSGVRPLRTEIENWSLGEGESIRTGRYEFVAPLNRGLNWAPPVLSSSASFNSNRWVFSEDSQIVLVHSVDYVLSAVHLPLRDARIELTIGHYVGGKCLVEAARYDPGTPWVPLGEIDGSRTAEFSLAPKFDSARTISIRLTGQKDKISRTPCSFQINDYRFSARVAEADRTLAGTTSFSEEDSPGGIARMDSIGASLGGRGDFICPVIENRLGKRLLVQARIEIDGITQLPPVRDVPSGEYWGIRFPYRAGRPGSHKATVTLRDAETSSLLLTAAWGYRVPILYDSSFGYLVSDEQHCDLWWAEGPYKISRRCPTPERRQPIVISAAKGEYESFQLALAPKRDLRNVRVKVSTLKSDGGAQIPADVVEVCRVGYVNVTQPTDEIGCVGDWPDPLPPCDKPFDLASKDGVQPLWVTVHVPRNAAAGDYRGTITLSADDWKTSVPFTVHVWDFEIPRENHLKTAFGFSTGNVRRYHNLTNDDELRQVVDLYFKNSPSIAFRLTTLRRSIPFKFAFPKSPRSRSKWISRALTNRPKSISDPTIVSRRLCCI